MPETRPPATPTLDLLATKPSAVISEFLEWLESDENEFVLARYHANAMGFHNLRPCMIGEGDHEALILRFFDIDPGDVARERRELLRYVQTEANAGGEHDA